MLAGNLSTSKAAKKRGRKLKPQFYRSGLKKENHDKGTKDTKKKMPRRSEGMAGNNLLWHHVDIYV